MYIFELGSAAAEGHEIGGKAGSLGKMIRMGLPVPKGYVITAGAFDGINLKKASAAEIAELVRKLSSKGHTYAVRSSAVGEDGAVDSFAGAYETVLDVKTEETILKNILMVVFFLRLCMIVITIMKQLGKIVKY